MEKIRIVDGFFILLLVGLTYAFYKVISLFLLDIFLAVILVNIFRGMFLFFCKKLPSWAASLSTVFILFIAILGILIFFAVVFSAEATGGMEEIQEVWPEFKDKLMALDVEEAIRTIPFLDEILLQEGGFEMSSLLDRAFQQFSTVVLEFIKRSFTGFTTALFHFVFVLFILFFLFLEGERLLDKIRSLIPLNEEDTEELVRDVANTTRATVVSTLIIGILEGTYGGVIFFLFGIPSPALWGIIIMIVSMIPVIGSNIIIVPAGILEIVTGEYLSGIVIILMGLGGVAVSQNILRPKLLGGRSGMHPMIVLLATLGGIAWLGLVGFLVGPMIASLFIVIWHQFAKKYKSRAEEAAEEAAE